MDKYTSIFNRQSSMQVHSSPFFLQKSCAEKTFVHIYHISSIIHFPSSVTTVILLLFPSIPFRSNQFNGWKSFSRSLKNDTTIESTRARLESPRPPVSRSRLFPRGTLFATELKPRALDRLIPLNPPRFRGEGGPALSRWRGTISSTRDFRFIHAPCIAAKGAIRQTGASIGEEGRGYCVTFASPRSRQREEERGRAAMRLLNFNSAKFEAARRDAKS